MAEDTTSGQGWRSGKKDPVLEALRREYESLHPDKELPNLSKKRLEEAIAKKRAQNQSLEVAVEVAVQEANREIGVVSVSPRRPGNALRAFRGSSTGVPAPQASAFVDSPSGVPAPRASAFRGSSTDVPAPEASAFRDSSTDVPAPSAFRGSSTDVPAREATAEVSSTSSTSSSSSTTTSSTSSSMQVEAPPAPPPSGPVAMRVSHVKAPPEMLQRGIRHVVSVNGGPSRYRSLYYRKSLGFYRPCNGAAFGWADVALRRMNGEWRLFENDLLVAVGGDADAMSVESSSPSSEGGLSMASWEQNAWKKEEQELPESEVENDGGVEACEEDKDYDPDEPSPVQDDDDVV